MERVHRMNPVRSVACAIGAGLCALSTPALASQQSYVYAVMHPFYGEIGTFTRVADEAGGVTRINTSLRVAVRLLGIVAYREESDGTEVLYGLRLMSLLSSITKNGTHSEVRGQAEGDHFVVSSPFGTFTAPADVTPSDPWLLKQTGVQPVVSTKTGRVEAAHISGGDQEAVTLDGVPVSARHFTVVTDKQQEVWLDSRDVPIMFRTMVDGTRIDFVLKSPLPPNVAAQAAAMPAPARHGADK